MKVYNDAKDKNVAAVMVYADTDKKLYYDAEFTKEVPAADIPDLFIKCAVALKDGTYYKPVSCAADGSTINFGF